jgi:hypothetical protein
MGKTRSQIDEEALKFIEAQHVFFVASAPLDAAGHVNLSPKGLDTFRILAPTKVAYVDFNGSGVETIAHLKENGRIVLMFCAFPNHENARSIIVVELTRVTDSCGYGVPQFKYEGKRTQLHAWASHRGPDGLKAYREQKNRRSIDGLPGISGE